jgi:tetratricopeptide (TPR) repeat protein
MSRRIGVLVTSLAFIGSMLSRHADAAGNEAPQSVQVAQTPGDVIACRLSLSRHCILELALAALEEIDDAPARYGALVTVSRSQARAAEFEAAAATVDRITVAYSWPPPRVTLVRLMAEAGRYEAARAMAEKIARADDRAMALLAIGGAATKAGRADLAQNAFAASLAAATSQPNDLRSRNFIFDLARTWAKVAPASADREITSAFAKAIGAANASADREQSTATVATIHALCGQVDAAVATLRELHDTDLIAGVETQIASARARTGDVAATRANQIQNGASRDGISSAAEFSAVVETASAIEDVNFRAIEFMLIAHSISTMADTGDARREIVAVLREAEKISDPQSRAQILWAVAQVQAKAGDRASARHTLTSILVTVDEIENFDLRATVFANFGIAMERGGYSEESKSAFESALRAADRVTDVLDARMDAIASIARSEAEAGNIAAARSIMEGLVEHRLRDKVMVSIAEAQAKSGHIAEALISADEIEDPGHRVDAFTRIADDISLRPN